jgi:hypothetical protein
VRANRQIIRYTVNAGKLNMIEAEDELDQWPRARLNALAL